jgi:hypothetical protein
VTPPPPVQSTPLGHTRRATPNFPPPQSAIDESVIKRMLKEEKHDRTPFS